MAGSQTHNLLITSLNALIELGVTEVSKIDSTWNKIDSKSTWNRLNLNLNTTLTLLWPICYLELILC